MAATSVGAPREEHRDSGEVTSRRSWVMRSLAFALAYALVATSAHLGVDREPALGLLWPVGLSAVWFAVCSSSPLRWLDPVLVLGICLVVAPSTGFGWESGFVFGAANAAHAEAFRRLLGIAAPHLWGAGGHEPMGASADLWRLLTSSAGSAMAWAGVSLVGVSVLIQPVTSGDLVLWLGRALATTLTVSFTGLLVGERIANAVREEGSLRAVLQRRVVDAVRSNPRGVEVVLLVFGFSWAVYAVSFSASAGLPLTFLTLTVSVWAGSRFPPVAAALHTMLVGLLVVSYTSADLGPFARLDDQVLQIVMAEIYVVLVTMVTMYLALQREERRRLVDELSTSQAASVRQTGLLTAIVDNMQDGVFLIGSDEEILLHNPSAAKLLGRDTSADRTVQQPSTYGVFDVEDGSRVEQHDVAHSRVLRGEHVTNQDYLIRNAAVPEGRVISVTGTPLYLRGDDQPPDALMIFHDVSAERRQRDDLRAFAGVVAHDLRNPLTVIRGWVDELEDAVESRRAGDASPVVAESASRISAAATRMETLITSLLAHSTAQYRQMDPKPVDLVGVVRDVVRTQIESRGDAVPAEIDVQDPIPRVLGERALLMQLVDNLLGNALKYQPEGQAPQVRVTADPAPDGWLHLRVTDNGIGIPHEAQPRVFDTFFRVGHGRYQGTGLGLAICKSIVERHGGEIWVADNPDGPGSQFELTLPLADVTPPADGASPNGTAGKGRPGDRAVGVPPQLAPRGSRTAPRRARPQG